MWKVPDAEAHSTNVYRVSPTCPTSSPGLGRPGGASTGPTSTLLELSVQLRIWALIRESYRFLSPNWAKDYKGKLRRTPPGPDLIKRHLPIAFEWRWKERTGKVNWEKEASAPPPP